MQYVAKILPSCKQCNGTCWVAGDQAKTQQNVRKRFGITPNSCVNDANGRIHCPFALGLL